MGCPLTLHRYHPHPKFLPYPAKHISIRGADDDNYTVIDVTKVGLPNGVPRILEEIELSRAIFELYEGGVVGHRFPFAFLRLQTHGLHLVFASRPDVHCKYDWLGATHFWALHRLKKSVMTPKWLDLWGQKSTGSVSQGAFVSYSHVIIVHQSIIQRFHVSPLPSLYYRHLDLTNRDVDAKQTHRIKEIAGSPYRSYFGSE